LHIHVGSSSELSSSIDKVVEITATSKNTEISVNPCVFGVQGFPFPDAPRRFGIERTSFPHHDEAEFWADDDGPEGRQRWPSTSSGRSSSSSASGDNASSQASSTEQVMKRPSSALPIIM
jgi:hypothetical protein